MALAEVLQWESAMAIIATGKQQMKGDELWPD
jgi:hypothetical protein